MLCIRACRRSLRFSLPLFLVLAPALASCTSVTVSRVADIDATGIAQVEGTVSITTSDGMDPNFRNSITDDFGEDDARVLQEAIVIAINENRLFTEVVEGEADYHLTAELVMVASQSNGFLSYTGSSAVNWTCTNRKTGEVLYSEKIRSEDKVTVGQAFAGPVRLVKAHEGAVRTNIAKALSAITQAIAHSQ